MDERAVKAEHEALHQTIAQNQRPIINKIETLDETLMAVVPKGMEVTSLKDIQDEYRLLPRYREASVSTHDLASFIDHTARYLSENSVLFADQPCIDGNTARFSMETIIDYHPAGTDVLKTGAGKHRIEYIAAIHARMARWLKGERLSMSQVDFASFIEDNMSDLTVLEGFRPPFGNAVATPADLLTLSRGLEVRVNQVVRNATRLATGETSLVFSTENSARGQDGSEVIVPEWFGLRLPIFVGTEPTIIPVRLRYKLHEGQIKFSYLFHGFDQVLEQTVNAAIAKVREVLPQLHVVEGV